MLIAHVPEDQIRDLAHRIAAIGDPGAVGTSSTALFDHADKSIRPWTPAAIAAFDDAHVAAQPCGRAGLIIDAHARWHAAHTLGDAVVIRQRHQVQKFARVGCAIMP